MKYIKRIVSIFFLIVIICGSGYKVENVVRQKDSYNRAYDFLEKADQIDVLFVGSSHVRNGFFPTELWKQYGITSFNLASNGNTIPISYWTIVNALDYCKPKVVVLDVFDMWPGKVCSGSWGQVLEAMDIFPLSLNKYRMVQDLFSDKELYDDSGNSLYDRRWGLLFGLSEYHTRWNDLSQEDFLKKNDFQYNSAIWKGADPLMKVCERTPVEYNYAELANEYEYDTLSRDYLIKTIELCQEKEIECLLINTGYDCSPESELFENSVGKIAQNYNINYIDFTEKNIINYDTDLGSNGYNTHVNYSGAQKLTAYIGSYLMTKYELLDHRSDELYETWERDRESNSADKAKIVRTYSDVGIKNCLIGLYDDEWIVIFDVKDNSIFYEDGNAVFFENIGIEDINSNSFVVLDRATNEKLCFYDIYNDGIDHCTPKGTLNVWLNEVENKYGVYLDGQELYTCDIEGSRLVVTVLDRYSGEVIDVNYYE